MHDDGRPLLGRKLKGKSKREMNYLGLTVDKDGGEGGRPEAGALVRCSARPPDRGS